MALHKKCQISQEENIKTENQFLALITMNKFSLLLLAGGMGSRYKGQKQIDGLNANNETLMEFALYDAIKVGIRKFVFIINEQFPLDYQKKISSLLSMRDCEAHFIIQTLNKFIPENYQSKVDVRTKHMLCFVRKM